MYQGLQYRGLIPIVLALFLGQQVHMLFWRDQWVRKVRLVSLEQRDTRAILDPQDLLDSLDSLDSLDLQGLLDSLDSLDSLDLQASQVLTALM